MYDERLKRLDEASHEGDTNKFKQLIEEDPSLLDGFDHFVHEGARDNPLHIAASRGHVDFTIEVLQLKPQLANMLNKQGRLPLHLAVESGHLQVVEKLADQQDCPQLYFCQDKKYGFMPVHIAAINGKHSILKILVERCSIVLNKATPRNETLLHLAVLANCLDSVCYLINQGVNLNQQDADGNTCLHLACQMKNYQVIKILLDQEGIEINVINAKGLTPLDVLLTPSLHSTTDVFLMSLLRRVGGKETKERKHKAERRSDAKILLVVATLVASMTFQAILNPPNDSFWNRRFFFILDSVALFSSISVILFLLCRIPKSKIVMKILVGVLWLAAFCTALAFGFAFYLMYDPLDDFEAYRETIGWMNVLLNIWFAVYAIAALWASFHVIGFLWKKGGFKKILPNWIGKINWPKNEAFTKTISIILIVCFIIALCFISLLVVAIMFLPL